MSNSSITSGGQLTFNNVSTIANPNVAVAPASLRCDGDIDCGGELRIKGRNIVELLDKIEDRLAILVPSEEKLKKFEALRKAYDHYKLMEKLCGENNENI